MSENFLDHTLEVTVSAERDALMKKAQGTGRAILILLIGGKRGERAILGEKKFVIGRGSASDLQINSDAVSRSHAYIEKRGDVHVLLDNGSTNGSFVNYERVSERILHDGDKIQVGQAMLKYLSGDNIETAYHEEFRSLVRRDALTDALNHATYEEELRAAVVKREAQDSPLSVIAFDLDHFKLINDEKGHTAGDLVLLKVAARMSEDVLEPHLFARTGGEEFSIIFCGQLTEAKDFAETLRKNLENLVIEYESAVIAVTGSFGVAGWSSGMSSQELHAAADKKLYEAKASGRNRVCF